MKILFTVSTYYPKNDGVANVTKYLAEGLVKLGHQVTVITSNKNELTSNEKYNGVDIIRVNLKTKAGLYFGDKNEYRKMILYYSKMVDIIINVSTQQAFTDIILRDIPKYECKTMLYKHDMFDFRFKKNDFISFKTTINKLWKEIRWFIYYNKNGKYFKKYDCVTELHKKCYGYNFFKRKYNIEQFIIENAADDEFFNKSFDKDFKKPFSKYILYVANYLDMKNQKLAIDEFLRSDIDKTIGLVLIGSSKNNYYNFLKRYITNVKEKLYLKENEKPILMLHNIKRELIPAYVSNSYLYLMTSKVERFPISLIESMACGVPFISTNVGIVKYLPGGIVANNSDINYYISQLANDNTYRSLLGNIGHKYAEKSFKKDAKVKDLEALISGLINK